MAAISRWDRPPSYASTTNSRYRTCAACRSAAAFRKATGPDSGRRVVGPTVDGRRLRFFLFPTPPTIIHIIDTPRPSGRTTNPRPAPISGEQTSPNKRGGPIGSRAAQLPALERLQLAPPNGLASVSESPDSLGTRRPDCMFRACLHSHPPNGLPPVRRHDRRRRALLERKRQIPIPGQGTVDVTEVGFRSTGEYWNEYLLDDGTVARIKQVVANVFRVDGETDDKGQPVYLIESTNITAISAEEK